MADGLNRCFFLGNLGQDPDFKVTQGGTSILTLSVGCNESYLDKNRVRQERVEWVRCVIFGKRAEALSKFLVKGTKVFIEGSQRTSSYEDREGVKRYKTEIMVKNVIVGGSNNPRGNSKRRDPDRERPNRREEEDSGAPAGGGGYAGDDYGSGNDDDQIPFVCAFPASSEKWWKFG